MYNLPKYKAYFKVKNFLSKFSSKRLLKFKATKWKTLQVYIKKNHRSFSARGLGSKQGKKNPLLKIKKIRLSISKRRILKLSRYFNEGVQLKRTLALFFNNGLSPKYFNNIRSSKSVIFKYLLRIVLIKPLFKLDILLWHLGLFKSLRQVHQLMQSKQILVNNKKVSLTQVLKKGDVISFNNINLKKCECMKTHCYSFLELDFFTNQIIILKEYRNLGDNDCQLLFPKVSFDVLKFLTHITL
jgi:ribosomal protein S4